jgi:hypothetical protein
MAYYSARAVGRLPKWPTGADCKSAGLRLRWFESITYHHLISAREKRVLTCIFNRFILVPVFDSVRFCALCVSCQLFRNDAVKYSKSITSPNWQIHCLLSAQSKRVQRSHATLGGHRGECPANEDSLFLGRPVPTPRREGVEIRVRCPCVGVPLLAKPSFRQAVTPTCKTKFPCLSAALACC